jgi:hypothetical protein
LGAQKKLAIVRPHGITIWADGLAQIVSRYITLFPLFRCSSYLAIQAISAPEAMRL